MKSAFLVLVFLVAASATYTDDTATILGTGKTAGTFGGDGDADRRGTERTADKEFLIRNRNILRLLNHVNMANTNQDQAAIGKEYRIETNLDRYSNVPAVTDFLRVHKNRLPRNKIFTISNDNHRDEAVSLFHVFYYAKDFETFYRTACYARDNTNEGVFVYALTVAVFHRRDTRGMALPPPCEIYPFFFLNSEVIQKAYRVRMQEKVHDTRLGNSNGVRQLDDKTFLINSNYSGWYTNTNEETSLTYFTEDIGLNTYYYYFHASYPFWMGGDEFALNQDRRGEYFLYTHQQLLARYYMERLSVNLDEIPRFLFTKPIRTGFKSSLKHPNGLEFPSRPNDYNLYTENNLIDLTTVADYERRIREAVDLGFITTEDGRTLSLRKAEDIERLGNIIQANRDSPNTRYYLLGSLTAKKLLGNGDDNYNDYNANPAVMEQYETALRDPVFYQLMQRLTHNVVRFKDNLRPYTREEVTFAGVKIEDITVDKLVTYFDTVDVDISNAVYRKREEVTDNRDDFVIRARQGRLNHVPFNVKLDISSDKSTESVIRIFLGPKYDSLNRKINFNDNRINFFELDRFVYTLKNGRNTINRNSREFLTTVADQTTTRDLFKKITTCINGNEECLVDTTRSRAGFPDRLLLPRGKQNGMTFYLYVVITPLRQRRNAGSDTLDNTRKNTPTTTYTTATKNTYQNDNTNERRNIDDNAFGYPLDRNIDRTTFFNSNMYLKEVSIFHRPGVQANMSDRDTETTDTTKLVDNAGRYSDRRLDGSGRSDDTDSQNGDNDRTGRDGEYERVGNY